MLTKTYTISCDTPGCTTKPISYSCEAGEVGAPGTVRHMAYEAGYRRGDDGQDACILHTGNLTHTDAPRSIHTHPAPNLSVDIGHAGRIWR
jgi:hypothetical protein